MLSDFIVANLEQISARAGALGVSRAPPNVGATSGDSTSLFFGHVVELLRSHASTTSVSPLASDPDARIAHAATRHGHESLRCGLTVANLIENYGCLRQALMELAQETRIVIEAQELQIFERCVERSTVAAVTAYIVQRERDLAYEHTERLGVLAHEMRNLLNTVTLSFAVIREGKVGLAGSTGAMLGRSLAGLGALVDRSLAEVRLATSAPELAPVSMLEFMHEMQVSAAAHAEGYGLQLTVHPVDRGLSVDADWQLLASSVSNLLHNAFKFTRPHGHVALVTRVTTDRVLIDVCDECGGLPPGSKDKLFRPFSRVGSDRSGLGLGLYIAQGAARANGGEIHVRDVPGSGCVFTIDLPRPAPSELSQ